MTPAIEFKNIFKQFGAVKANDHLSFSVAKGSIHGILGENGAGKSTLMSILYGYYQADSGQILQDGQPASIRNSRQFEKSAWLPRLNEWLPVLGQTPVNISLVMALAALVLYAVLIWRPPWGYRVRTLGLNPHAAHYAGVSIQRTIIGVTAGSGALAGMAAVNSEMGSSHHLGLNFTAGAGFIGIAVALMGRTHPVGILLSALLFGGLIQGGFDVSLEKPGIAPKTFIFIQGLIILFFGAMENLYAPALAALLKRAAPDSQGLA